MGEVYFYHLTRTPLAATLPVIVAKSLDKGWRVLLASSDAERLAVLDEMLWRDGFIPHGISGGVADADQPVLLTVDGVSVNANKADILVLVDGVALDIALVSNFKRVCLLFNGDDAGALTQARADWKTLVAEGMTARYYAQEARGWVAKLTIND